VLQFHNRQRARRIDLRFLRRVVRALLERHFQQEHFRLCFHLVTAAEMARVNEQFLRHDGPTDVITFDYREPGARLALHGEIFLCVEVAVAQARAFRVPWQEELTRYVLHALLHLHGYDDRKAADRRRMKRAENQSLRLLSATLDLTQLEPPVPSRAGPRRVRGCSRHAVA
jgi:probable rRNA maturation factor